MTGYVVQGTGHLVGRMPSVSTSRPSQPAVREMGIVAGIVTMYTQLQSRMSVDRLCLNLSVLPLPRSSQAQGCTGLMASVDLSSPWRVEVLQSVTQTLSTGAALSTASVEAPRSIASATLV